MKLDILLAGLKNPQPPVRLDVVRVLGMLDETRALEALRQHYQTETDPAVRNAVAWAGKRLYEAQQSGYSTVDELCRYFGVDREIENTPDAAEAEVIKKMQEGFESDMRQLQMRTQRRQLGLAAAAGLAGGMVGGAAVGFASAAGALQPGAGAASSNLSSGRPQIGTQRAPATKPSNTDIGVWLRRLRESSAPAQREQAAIQLAELNNPAALPYLAAVFVGDDSPLVRQAAQKYGKVLYWSAVYWEMEQDGSLAAEMARRAQALGKTVTLPGQPAPDAGAPGAAAPAASAPSASPPPKPSPAEADVSEILRKAQQARARRKKKK